MYAWLDKKISLAGSISFLLLVVVNITLLLSNRYSPGRSECAESIYTAKSTVEKIYQPLVRALAELAATRHDAQLKSLLNSQGINFSSTPTPTPK